MLAQEPEKQTPIPTTPKADCEPNNCISKVLYVPEFSTAGELQYLVNTFRSIADFRIIYPNQSDHTVGLKGDSDQFAIAERLLSVLASLLSSGGHDRSSVLVYQFKGHLSGTARAEQMLAQAPRVASTICDLSTCYIKAMHLPDFSTSDLHDFMNRLRTTADITRTDMIPSRDVVVFEGTVEQVAIAEKLFVNARTPQ